ncbi:hypothetical protein NBRC3257_1364 [Gluconobacter thailandicus NBRC 3257]|uniref:Uncharacterized protein n=1 Tax=Gluconobacter thailandicus NBRC 3257 TaxID=1381097 RepID=A0ABQ0IVZ1_GLUTH|nr:hypothetical protein NBRC3255_1448 [Gluconobacter thailandicus NBRC 3255]GAD26365.1 hypothetical protein NBRC3257_1364 [Gluconobacter thailandicus NBRC 3257]
MRYSAPANPPYCELVRLFSGTTRLLISSENFSEMKNEKL